MNLIENSNSLELENISPFKMCAVIWERFKSKFSMAINEFELVEAN